MVKRWIWVKYCSQGMFGKSYSTGSVRLWDYELTDWIAERTKTHPILITDITILKTIEEVPHEQ